MFKRIIVESGNQIDAQHQASPPIPIPLGQNPKDFQMPNHVFNQYSFACQLLVRRFLPGGQVTAFRLFYRRSALFVQLLNALITGIRQTTGSLWKAHFARFIQRKIVPCPFSESGVQNSPRPFAHPHLCFYGVPLLLARIIATLFFFGRSTAVSTTSTMTTSTSGGRFSRRLTGSRNSRARLKISAGASNNARNG